MKLLLLENYLPCLCFMIAESHQMHLILFVKCAETYQNQLLPSIDEINKQTNVNEEWLG